MKEKHVPLVGQVFLVKLDGYGIACVRVLKTRRTANGTPSSLIGVSTLIGGATTGISDIEIGLVHIQGIGTAEEEPNVYWYDGFVPLEFSLLGSIAPVFGDERYESIERHGGILRPGIVESRLIQNQVISGMGQSELSPIPTGDEVELFWRSIEEFSKSGLSDTPSRSSLFAQSVLGRGATYFLSWHRTMCWLLYEIDGPKFAKALGEVNEQGVVRSSDLFLYARIGAVLQGREVYGSLLSGELKTLDVAESELLLEVCYSGLDLFAEFEEELTAVYGYESFSNVGLWGDELPR